MKDLVVLFGLGGLLHATRSLRPHDGDVPDVAATALAFGFLLLSAHHAGRLLARVGLPKLVAYLITGAVVGPEVLGLVSPSMVDALSLVNGVAICLIALTAGGELKVRRLRPLLRVIAALSGWAVLGTCVVLSALVFALRPLLPFFDAVPDAGALWVAGLLGIVLSAQSPAVVMALLTELDADGPVTRTVLGTVVIADLAIIVLFGFASSAVHAALGEDADLLATAGAIIWELVGSMGAGCILGALLGIYLRYVRNQVALFVLLECVVVAELGKHAHLDPLIVMLSAGIFVENAMDVDAASLVHDIEAASLPVFIVFFALAGAELHLATLTGLALPALSIVLVRAASFRLGAAVATAYTKAPPEVGRWAWVGLLPQAGLALALAQIIRRAYPAFGDEASALIFAVIAANEIAMPVVLRRALTAAGEAGARRTPDPEPADDLHASAATG